MGRRYTRALRLRPSQGGNVILTERFWNPDYLPESDVVPSLSIFADESIDGDERQTLIAQDMWRDDEDLQKFH
ncbi:hypothetical protein JR346_01060 [Rothia sp. ZJ932]|uniref:type IV toxin-antitoxin system AbiEi family antitoxin n=1 Tax=Rothia sp. ZJ1223 TaxID=2811098 RepID=UPI00195DB889|nr:hypothetical protein [Rothia sp. ZJ1223]QRZ61762.1 hypothetical protein JR346_01060 [Rothia sp. ZJ932]